MDVVSNVEVWRIVRGSAWYQSRADWQFFRNATYSFRLPRQFYEIFHGFRDCFSKQTNRYIACLFVANFYREYNLKSFISQFIDENNTPPSGAALPRKLSASGSKPKWFSVFYHLNGASLFLSASTIHNSATMTSHVPPATHRCPTANENVLEIYNMATEEKHHGFMERGWSNSLLGRVQHARGWVAHSACILPLRLAVRGTSFF